MSNNLSTGIPLSAKIELWRQKVADGTITLEEMKEAVAAIRAGRVSAAQTSAKSHSKKAAATVNVNDLMNGLEKL